MNTIHSFCPSCSAYFPDCMCSRGWSPGLTDIITLYPVGYEYFRVRFRAYVDITDKRDAYFYELDFQKIRSKFQREFGYFIQDNLILFDYMVFEGRFDCIKTLRVVSGKDYIEVFRPDGRAKACELKQKNKTA